MELTRNRLVVEVDGAVSAARFADDPADAPSSSSGTVVVGGLAVSVDASSPGAVSWEVENMGSTDVRVRSVALVYSVTDVAGDLRLFCNGYQSWSPTGVATFGVDEDRSCKAHFPMLQGVYAADQRDARPGELRAEWVTALEDGSGAGAVVIGFEAGTGHDGTFRLRPAEAGAASGVAAELWVEAFLGDVVVPAGAGRSLHSFAFSGGDGTPVGALLEAWASATAAVTGARVAAPFQLGWCSWYHYFHDVTEQHIRTNLALAVEGAWPFDVFQIDDGFQSAIGDWLTTNDKFPTGLAPLAATITDAGFAAGLWIAPFLVAPDSVVATEHPDWLAQAEGDDGARTPLYCWWNPPWGGGHDGLMYGLDTTLPAVQDHLAAVAAALVGMGFTYLKLDFTFAPSLDGVWHDPTMTPAERVRAGYAAVRRGAGDDAFILGCGVPLANVVGIVDGNRIGQDVAPLWALDPAAELVPGFQGVEPSTQNALGNTLARAFMHRRLWLNDPDCLMLRTADTALSAGAARTWALAVGLSGGMALVSDDLGLLDDRSRALLEEVVALGRASDEAAVAGRTPTVPDLLSSRIPTTIAAVGRTLVVDVADGSSTFS